MVVLLVEDVSVTVAKVSGGVKELEESARVFIWLSRRPHPSTVTMQSTPIQRIGFSVLSGGEDGRVLAATCLTC
jgi:hypothetical protein